MSNLPEDVVDLLSRFLPRDDLQRLRPVTGIPGQWLPACLGVGATTLGHYVFFRRGRYNTETARGLALIAHEAVHVGQFREVGLPRFLLRYAGGRFRARFRHDRHVLEIPANRLQREVRDSLRAEGWP